MHFLFLRFFICKVGELTWWLAKCVLVFKAVFQNPLMGKKEEAKWGALTPTENLRFNCFHALGFSPFGLEMVFL